SARNNVRQAALPYRPFSTPDWGAHRCMAARRRTILTPTLEESIMAPTHRSRRDFMKGSLATLAAAGMAHHAFAQSTNEAGIPTRPLGKTGVQVSILGLGGHHIGQIKDDQESIDFIRYAIDNGVTFLDNAWEYHDGRSED